MPRFGTIPPEPARLTSLDGLAPKFRDKVRDLLARMRDDGHQPVVFEALRSADRCAWLYGFGRDYDDGRGVVTHAENGAGSWHSYGTAVDIVDRDGNCSGDFRASLGSNASALGLTWGGLWEMKDYPHVQWAPMRVSPGDTARQLYAEGRPFDVWPIVGAA